MSLIFREKGLDPFKRDPHVGNGMFSDENNGNTFPSIWGYNSHNLKQRISDACCSPITIPNPELHHFYPTVMSGGTQNEFFIFKFGDAFDGFCCT